MNKFRVLIAIVMVLTLVSSLMLVPAFADETEEIAVESAEVLAATDEAAEDEHADHDHSAETGEIADDTTGAAVVEHDHDGDGIADHDASAHDNTATTDDGWTTLGVSDYIALVVAAVILVAFVVALILFVPRKTKQR